ncbi:LysM peptidoglycan-binding domain-containing protein [Patescibacteria group bacterium]|nr:LysM peptidoglycan-binding domain-containing protein [Patescibacteria group bacterium]
MAQTEQKDGLALIVGGLFILALVFAAYNYFNKTDNLSNGLGSKSGGTEEVKGKSTREGELIGEGISTSTEEAQQQPGGAQITTPSWQATDYKEGDIAGKTYTVKAGDTLWEISEAVYGNGLDWVKILNANPDSVGYLPNGQQALIMPGQVLVLP